MTEQEMDKAPESVEENTGQVTEEPIETAQAKASEEVNEEVSEEAEAEAEEAEDAEEEAGEEAKGEGKKSWAERRAEKKQAKQKNDAMKEQIEQLEDKVKRQLAEFENFRNRTEREKQAMFETGARSVIEKILPVVDNFERGLATVSPENQNDAFVDGMNKVYKQLITELDNMGVKPIECVGKEFDPNLHNAVMQVESEEYESGIVAQELQKGYTYRDVVVRHSMVSVVQ
ncbi:MAG: nucleotide exchange factor GrpE [Lachnospiraceae bacterium]|nr:nucleotide exchange factor GrpE [Lachnospiraceae bacterium]